MTGTLFLVATPIGNLEDITLRALNTLKFVDVVLVEEYREGSRLLKKYGFEKEIILLNEHNEKESVPEVIKLLKQGKNIALISDSGTPVFSDPGKLLVKEAINENIRLIPVPGASSLLPALIVSGFKTDRFLFYGWLSQKKEKRKIELQNLKKETNTIVLMDTPYRLKQLLIEISEVFKKERKICLAYNLTMADEMTFHGYATDIFKIVEDKKLKGEFVILIEEKR